MQEMVIFILELLIYLMKNLRIGLLCQTFLVVFVLVGTTGAVQRLGMLSLVDTFVAEWIVPCLNVVATGKMP